MSDRFEKLADEFIARVQAATLKADTDVILTVHGTDEEGEPRSFSFSLVPCVTVCVPGNPDGATGFAADLHAGGIINAINGLVRPMEEGLLRWRDMPKTPIRVTALELEIK